MRKIGPFPCPRACGGNISLFANRTGIVRISGVVFQKDGKKDSHTSRVVRYICKVEASGISSSTISGTVRSQTWLMLGWIPKRS